MHPPQHIVDELQRLHKWVRLGWMGFDRTGPEDELNKGTFVLLQLYHQRDLFRSCEGLFLNRGPIFGKRYDPLQRFPIMKARIHPKDVFSGKVVHLLKYMMKPIRQRVIESALAKGKDYDRQVSELGGEMGEYMYWRANKFDSPRDRTRTKDDVTAEDKAVLRGERKKDLTTAFLPPKGSYV